MRRESDIISILRNISSLIADLQEYGAEHPEIYTKLDKRKIEKCNHNVLLEILKRKYGITADQDEQPQRMIVSKAYLYLNPGLEHVNSYYRKYGERNDQTSAEKALIEHGTENIESFLQTFDRIIRSA